MWFKRFSKLKSDVLPVMVLSWLVLSCKGPGEDGPNPPAAFYQDVDIQTDQSEYGLDFIRELLEDFPEVDLSGRLAVGVVSDDENKILSVDPLGQTSAQVISLPSSPYLQPISLREGPAVHLSSNVIVDFATRQATELPPNEEGLELITHACERDNRVFVSGTLDSIPLTIQYAFTNITGTPLLMAALREPLDDCSGNINRLFARRAGYDEVVAMEMTCIEGQCEYLANENKRFEAKVFFNDPQAQVGEFAVDSSGTVHIFSVLGSGALQLVSCPELSNLSSCQLQGSAGGIAMNTQVTSSFATPETVYYTTESGVYSISTSGGSPKEITLFENILSARDSLSVLSIRAY